MSVHGFFIYKKKEDKLKVQNLWRVGSQNTKNCWEKDKKEKKKISLI